MVSTMVSSSRRRSSMAWLAAVKLRGGGLGELAAGLKIGGHVVEGAHQLGHFAGGDEGDAVVVFAGGDLVHGVGERFDGTRDLLGEKQGEPHAGEEDHHGDEEQHEEEGGADAVAGTEEVPVVCGAAADACGGLAEALRAWGARRRQLCRRRCRPCQAHTPARRRGERARRCAARY